jgi:hypothetical protein
MNATAYEGNGARFVMADGSSITQREVRVAYMHGRGGDGNSKKKPSDTTNSTPFGFGKIGAIYPSNLGGTHSIWVLTSHLLVRSLERMDKMWSLYLISAWNWGPLSDEKQGLGGV